MGTELSYLLSSSLALPSFPAQNLGSLQVTAELTQTEVKHMGPGVTLPGSGYSFHHSAAGKA